ncbi:hypothetical protein HMPREF1544_01566 [Mucor circinelloides 1006PhL]|uniref:Uncharacterized protein n=1 Tax=Mucor circinelloides f. circinelloides (strain 1006PhL) TaxID=1220926 RepID=S2JNW7_MUCC1|nr:hypothetical protein HMPREF1544_01566 [Mucor circinelloides 1006PhL]
MSFNLFAWFRPSPKAPKWTKQASEDIELVADGIVCAADKLKRNLRALQEVECKKLCHEHFAGQETLTRIKECENLTKKVEVVKDSQQDLRQQTLQEMEHHRVSMEHLADNRETTSQQHIALLRSSSESLSELYDRNQDMLNRIIFYQGFIAPGKSSVLDLILDTFKRKFKKCTLKKALLLVTPPLLYLPSSFCIITTGIAAVHTVIQVSYQVYLHKSVFNDVSKLKETLKSSESQCKRSLHALHRSLQSMHNQVVNFINQIN